MYESLLTELYPYTGSASQTTEEIVAIAATKVIVATVVIVAIAATVATVATVVTIATEAKVATVATVQQLLHTVCNLELHEAQLQCMVGRQ